MLWVSRVGVYRCSVESAFPLPFCPPLGWVSTDTGSWALGRISFFGVWNPNGWAIVWYLSDPIPTVRCAPMYSFQPLSLGSPAFHGGKLAERMATEGMGV